MHDANGMRRRQPIGGRNRVPERVGKAQAFLRDQLLQRTPLDIFHGDEQQVARYIDLVDGDNVGVAQSGRGLGFLYEARLPFRNGRGLLRKHLDGDQTVQAVVTGFVDRAHASFAQFFDIEMRNPGSEWNRWHDLCSIQQSLTLP